MFIYKPHRPEDAANLAEAQGMQEDGADQQEIFDNTAWFKSDVDDAWRGKIPDLDASMKGLPDDGAAVPLDQAIDHPELFEAAPHLKEVTMSQADGQGRGFYVSELDHIVLEDDQDLDAALHEIEHSEQARHAPPGSTGADYNEAGMEAYEKDPGEREAYDVIDRYHGEDGPPDLLGAGSD